MKSDKLALVKHEIKEVAMVSIYFFFCFVVILVLKKLLLADYKIEVDALSTAAISALIVGKIVIILDKTSAGNRFDATHALGVAALYKTLVYVFATFLVLFLEKLFHAYHENPILLQALNDVWIHRNLNVMLAKILVIGLSFFCFHLYAGLQRILGKGVLQRIIVQRPDTLEMRTLLNL